MSAAGLASRERPILFSGPMVRAIFDGRKTQTRRPISQARHSPVFWDHAGYELHPDSSGLWRFHTRGRARVATGSPVVRCPYGKPGDRLWVRETYALADEHAPDRELNSRGVFYRATHSEADASVRWKPSIHMPRWASRLTLVVTDVRVQRLQEISEEDARAEGQGIVWGGGCRYRSVAGLWDSINGKRAPWASNPWVWALTFKRLT